MRVCDDKRCIFERQKHQHNRCFDQVTTKTREGKGLWEKCRRCELVINRNGVDLKTIDQYYNTKYVHLNTYGKKKVLTVKQDFPERLNSLRPSADFLKQHLTRNMHLMDLGAGAGELMYLLRDSVKYVCGNEINVANTEFIRNQLGIDALSEDYLLQNTEKQFDCIISINTIDHMYNPRKVIEKIYTDLKDNGIIYIEVPNDDQALRHFLPEPQRTMFEEFMYQKAHYYSFSMNTLRRMLREVGFKIYIEQYRHDYTFKNYLQWYFLGESQTKIVESMGDPHLQTNRRNFGCEMDKFYDKIDIMFKEIMAKNKVGETLCILGKKQ